MALEQTLNETLTQAIKAKDTRTADVVRMLKTKDAGAPHRQGLLRRRWTTPSSST